MKASLKKPFLCISILFFAMICVIPVDAAPKIKLNTTKKTMYVEDTYVLKVSGTDKKVKWLSSDITRATVSSAGKVHVTKPGNVVIRARVGDKTLKCKIEVLRVAKGALKYLKGSWQSVSMWNGEPKWRAAFSEQYCKMKYTGEAKQRKIKIVAITKATYGYFIRMEGGYGYRLNMEYPDTLELVTTWKKNSLEGYSGSSSLIKNNI